MGFHLLCCCMEFSWICAIDIVPKEEPFLSRLISHFSLQRIATVATAATKETCID